MNQKNLFPEDNEDIQKGSDDWLLTVYKEAWKLYIYHFDISEKRNNLFVGIQSAILALLAGLFVPISQIEPLYIFSKKISIGLVVWGGLAVVFSVFAILISKFWEDVTHSAWRYHLLRWISARAVEVEKGIYVNLAGEEHNWREFSRQELEKPKGIMKNKYFPFPKLPTMDKHPILLRRKIGGWDSTLNLIKHIKYLWWFVLIVGLIIFFGSVTIQIFIDTIPSPKL